MNTDTYQSSLSSICTVLYASSDYKNNYNQAVLNLSSKYLKSTLNKKEALSQYNKFFLEHGYNFDFLIIDSNFDFTLKDEILAINPLQNIFINIKLDCHHKHKWENTENLLHEPLKTSVVTQLFNNLLLQDSKNSVLSRFLEEDTKCTQENIEKLEQYEDKLKEMETKLKSQADFFASMSHEIRTPMNAIIGMSQILMDDTSLSKKQSTTIKTVNNSSNMLLGIINNILDFSKIEANMLTLESISLI